VRVRVRWCVCCACACVICVCVCAMRVPVASVPVPRLPLCLSRGIRSRPPCFPPPQCLRLAFADTRWYVADPDVTHVPVAAMLSKHYAATRRAGISMEKSSVVDKGVPFAGTDTVSFSVVDSAGNAVSFINR
jgi:hypothetical protein